MGPDIAGLINQSTLFDRAQQIAPPAPASNLQALRLKLPEDLSKPSLYGIGFGAPIGVSTLLQILGEKTLRNLLPPQLRKRALNEIKGLNFKLSAFVAAPPGALGSAEAFKKGAGLFISITFPGSKASWVLTVSKGQASIQIGRGISKPVAGGAGLLLGNVYGGARGVGTNPAGVGNALVAPLFKVPGSKFVQNLLAEGIRFVGNRAAAAGAITAPATGGASLSAGGLAKLLSTVLAAVVSAPTIYAGPAYGVTAVDDKQDGFSIQRGNRPPRDMNIDNVAEEVLAMFAGYSPFGIAKNEGSRGAAIAQVYWQLERSTSIFQLAAVSGGRNLGLPWLEMTNRMNHILQRHGLLARRPSSPLPGILQNVQQNSYVVMFENLRNGQHASEMLIKLRTQLKKTAPAEWQAFVQAIKPLAQRYQLNFGLPELSVPIGPTMPLKPEDKKIRNYFLRDWNKGQTPDRREVVPVPRGLTA